MKKLLALKLVVLILSLLTFAESLGGIACAVNNEYQVDQAIEVGIYILENNATQTNAAAFFDVTEMTIRNYIYRLQTINPLLYQQVREIVERRRYTGRIKDPMDFAIEVGIYIVENDATQTNAAAFFDVTEMTIRNYIYRLQTINPLLYQQVREIVEQNRSKHRYRLRRI